MCRLVGEKNSPRTETECCVCEWWVNDLSRMFSISCPLCTVETWRTFILHYYFTLSHAVTYHGWISDLCDILLSVCLLWGFTRMSSRCLWDADTDNYAEDVFMNASVSVLLNQIITFRVTCLKLTMKWIFPLQDSLFCVVAVFGSYYYWGQDGCVWQRCEVNTPVRLLITHCCMLGLCCDEDIANIHECSNPLLGGCFQLQVNVVQDSTMYCTSGAGLSHCAQQRSVLVLILLTLTEN